MENTAQNTKGPVLEMIEVAIASPQNPDVPALENINWRVNPGDYWVVGGLHGSGKSDLISTAAGLQNPLHGSVNLFGRDVSALREKELSDERLRVGVVFGDGGRMFNRLTVEENIALPLCYHRDLSMEEARSVVSEILELIELKPFAHHTATTLRQSWQQRVGLARALALKPEILFLDKPFIGLEVRHRKWWFDFLAGLSSGIPFTNNQPVTLVLTTDNLQLWQEHGNQFALIKQNRWHSIGGREPLKNNEEEFLRDLDEFNY